MTLDKVSPGGRVIVRPVRGQGMARRLYDLGIMPGAELEIIASHPFRGPVLVRASGTTIALGRGLAQMIPVTRRA